MQAYSTYFDNLFLALRMARPAYKAQALYTLRTVRDASLGNIFDPLLTALETATTGFDENLSDRNQSTAGGIDAYHLARTAWLAFVDDTMKDYVTPKLRKLPIYADFKKFGKSKLASLDQPSLLTNSKALVDLYTAQQGQLYPALGADAAAMYAAIVASDTTRDEQEAITNSAILALAADRAAIASAQRRLKAQLELTFDDPDKVYSFFDFSDARLPKSKKKGGDTPPAV